MRPLRRVVTIPAGGTWPEQESTVQVPPFSWIRLSNRGVPGSGNDLWMSLLGPFQPGDKPDTIVTAGTSVVQNIGGHLDPPAESLHLKNVGTVAIDVVIELSDVDSPIIHLRDAMSPASTGALSALGAQSTQLAVMQNAATANGNGTQASVDGYSGAQQVEIAETGGGTATVALQGSMDGVNWIPGVGYQQVDGIASPVRAVANINVLANSRHVYQLLDPYRFVRAVLSAVAGGAVVTARVYAVPA